MKTKKFRHPGWYAKLIYWLFWRTWTPIIEENPYWREFFREYSKLWLEHLDEKYKNDEHEKAICDNAREFFNDRLCVTKTDAARVR